MKADIVVVIRGGLCESVYLASHLYRSRVAVVDLDDDAREDRILASAHQTQPLSELDGVLMEFVEGVSISDKSEECPNCGGDNSDFGEVSIEGQNAIQEGSCPDCGASFRHVYTMSTAMILSVDKPDDDEGPDPMSDVDFHDAHGQPHFDP